eukprot:4215626-Pleurochrysis_carterae.AAC.1
MVPEIMIGRRGQPCRRAREGHAELRSVRPRRRGRVRRAEVARASNVVLKSMSGYVCAHRGPPARKLLRESRGAQHLSATVLLSVSLHQLSQPLSEHPSSSLSPTHA